MKKILICDDDKDILDVCRLILEKKNYEVFTAADSESIFPLLEKTSVDIILLDLGLPGMGGEACARLLKENDATCHIPLILFSANSQIEHFLQKTKADGIIRKPFDIRKFVTVIEEYLANKG